MQLEVILPLVAYLVVVFGISVYAMRKRSTGTFLNEYFLGSRSMELLINTGWAGYCWR